MIRVDVDRPKPTYNLAQRAPRIRALRRFQPLIDATLPGGTLKPEPGTYAGPVTVDKPLRIDGGGAVTIDAGDRGTVFVLKTSGARLIGVHLTGSGESPDTDDSCLDIRGDDNLVADLQIDNCMIGIDLKQSNRNVLRGNHIRSKGLALNQRGDAVRLWYSHDNLLEHNEIADSRDMVAWYSNRNVFRSNVSQHSRYSLHFMFSNDNLVEGNRFEDNTIGVYLMYAEHTRIRNNVISRATGAAGMAIGFKESSDAEIDDNQIIYCAIGVGSDLSPFQPGTTIRFRRNRLAFNGIAVHFTSELGGNEFSGNSFEGNLTDVIQSGRGTAGLNHWRENYFDSYVGFDRDHDGYGDTPHEQYAYADQIWIESPAARFFQLTPLMELLDFLERLAPLSTPELQLRDERPRFVRPEPRS